MIREALKSMNDPSQDTEVILALAHFGFFTCLALQPITSGSPVFEMLFDHNFKAMFLVGLVNLTLSFFHLYNSVRRLLRYKIALSIATLVYGSLLSLELALKIPSSMTSGIFIVTFILFVMLPMRKIYHYTKQINRYTAEYEEEVLRAIRDDLKREDQ